jgi:Tfp pilus assembly protein PilF
MGNKKMPGMTYSDRVQAAERAIGAGKTAFDVGEYVDALAHFRAAVKQSPSYPPSKKNLSRALGRLTGTPAVREEHRVASHTQDGQPDYLYQLGAAHCDLGHFVQAQPYLAQALGQQADHPELNAQMGICLAGQHRSTEAIPFFAAALSGAPDNANWHHRLGLCYLEAANLQQASSHILRAIHLAPKNPGYHLSLTLVFVASKVDGTLVDECYHNALRVTETNAQLQHLQNRVNTLARNYRDQGFEQLAKWLDYKRPGLANDRERLRRLAKRQIVELTPAV